MVTTTPQVNYRFGSRLLFICLFICNQKTLIMPIRTEDDVLIKANPNLTIFRYMDLDKFESLLKENALFFCRSDKFSDPFEGSNLTKEVAYRVTENKNLAARSGKIISEEEAQNNSNNLGEFHRKAKKSFIVNCWHINNGESDAMWRLYLKTNEGVAIQSTVGDLIKSFKNTEQQILMSKVRYLDYNEDIYYHPTEYPQMAYNAIAPIIHKRLAFIHESELRIFEQITEAIHDDNYWHNQPNKLGKFIPVDLNLLINRVILPPTSEQDVKDAVQKLLSGYGFDFTIEQSALNDQPIF